MAIEMEKNGRKLKCSLLKTISDRFSVCAADYSQLTGRPCDEKKYTDLGSIIQRKVCQRLRSLFIWEDHRFIDFDPLVFYSSNLMVQIESVKMQKIAHDYRRMLEHMRDCGLICISEHFCHEPNTNRFCKSYTIHPALLRSAIDTSDEVELVESEIHQSEIDEIRDLAKMAKQTSCVEYNGLKLHFDIDDAMRHLSDDFTSCQKDKYCLTVSKMKSALWAWIDRKRQHKDHIVDFRNFHFLTSMPKAALKYIYDERGRRFREILDLPSGNILTTAISFYKEGSIPESEYFGILRGIFTKDGAKSTYDQFISDTKSEFPRTFVKKCFQTVINCSDRQMKRHEKKAKYYSDRPNNIHFKTSKCVVDIYNWLIEKFPKYGINLRNYDCIPSTNRNGTVKGTYYSFTYVEKEIIEGIQSKIPFNSIRIHDAIWGFEDYSDNLRDLKDEIKRISKEEGGFLRRDGLRILISNKVSKSGSGHPPVSSERVVMTT